MSALVRGPELHQGGPKRPRCFLRGPGGMKEFEASIKGRNTVIFLLFLIFLLIQTATPIKPNYKKFATPIKPNYKKFVVKQEIVHLFALLWL